MHVGIDGGLVIAMACTSIPEFDEDTGILAIQPGRPLHQDNRCMVLSLKHN